MSQTDWLDVGLLVLRVWAGVVMLAHGVNHARNREGTTRWFGSVGFRSPRLNARLSAINEIAIGIALVLGLLSGIASAGLVATMVVAFWAIHRFAGFFVFHRPDEGYEYVLTLAVIALVIAIVGPGAFSLDAALGWDDVFDGPAGVGIFGAGIAVAAAQLAIFWRKPKETDPS